MTCATPPTPAALDAADPEVVVHAAAWSRADQVYQDQDRAWEINVAATGRLADFCAAQRRRLVFTSTDLVFDGSRPWNREDDPAEPVVAYGRTKRAAEELLLERSDLAALALVVRLSLLYGPSRRADRSPPSLIEASPPSDGANPLVSSTTRSARPSI